MKLKLLWIIVVALLVVGGSVTTVAILNSPANVAANALSGVAEDMLEREDVKPIYQTLTGGSVQVSLNSIKKDGENCFGDTHLSGKLYFAEDALMLSDFDAKLGEFEFAGDAYISEEEFYIKEDKILGGAYGMNISTLADDLANSIFAADSGSEYALDQETYDSIIKMLDNVSKNKDIREDAVELLETVSEDFWKIVKDNADISSESTYLRLNGTKTKVRLITITVDAIAMENILMDAYDYLCESEDIIEFIETNEAFLVAMMRDMYPAYYPHYQETYSSLVEAYEKWMEILGERIENRCDALDPTLSLAVNIATPRMRTTLLKLWVTIGKETVLSLDCGEKGIKKTDEISLEMGGVKLSYKVYTEEELTATFIINGQNGLYVYVSVCVNQEKGMYTLTCTKTDRNDRKSWSIKGNIDTNGDTITLTIDNVTRVPATVYAARCEIIIDTDDKMPSPRKDYDTVADITENDIKAWVKKLEELGLRYE